MSFVHSLDFVLGVAVAFMVVVRLQRLPGGAWRVFHVMSAMGFVGLMKVRERERKRVGKLR